MKKKAKIAKRTKKTKITKKTKKTKRTQFDSIRCLVGGYYDIQKLRIQTFNRLTKQCKKCKKKDKIRLRKKQMDWYCDRCKIKVPTITTEKELEEFYLKLRATEDDVNKTLKKWVEQFPIYTEHLIKVRGIGHIISAGLVAWLYPIKKFNHVSKLWRYCGLAVIDGKAERRKKGEKLHYSPKLKSFCWNIGASFIRQNAEKSGYRKLYDEFKEQYQRKTAKRKYDKGSRKMHVHLMALRKMVKIFLSHFWEVSRKMEKLPVTEPYPMEHMGHVDKIEPIIDITDEPQK